MRKEVEQVNLGEGKGRKPPRRYLCAHEGTPAEKKREGPGGIEGGALLKGLISISGLKRGLGMVLGN